MAGQKKNKKQHSRKFSAALGANGAKGTRKFPRPRKGNVDMEFLCMKTLSDLSVDKRIEAILRKVKDGRIVVLDQALDTDEEAKLVTATMKGIKGEFTGIEYCTLPSNSSALYNVMVKLAESIIRRDIAKPGLTFVGPSYLIEKIQRDPNAFYVSTRRKA